MVERGQVERCRLDDLLDSRAKGGAQQQNKEAQGF